MELLAFMIYHLNKYGTHTKIKKDQSKNLIKKLKISDIAYSNFWEPKYAERSPDDKREDIAKMLLWGIFLLFLFLSSILAILVFNNNQNATLFKDVFFDIYRNCFWYCCKYC